MGAGQQSKLRTVDFGEGPEKMLPAGAAVEARGLRLVGGGCLQPDVADRTYLAIGTGYWVL